MSEPSKLDLRSLRYILALSATGSFARAAAALGITQPALSRSVRALETSLGLQLFDRGRGGTSPTAFGRLLIERGATLLAEAGALERELRLLDGADVGALVIGAGTYPAQISVGESAARLIARHPGLELRIVVADWPELVRQVLADETDLAICEYATAETDERLVIEALPVHSGCLYCRAGHPLASATSIDLAEARRFPLALTSLPARAANLARAHSRDAATLKPDVHVDTFDLARQIVLGSDAIGVAARSQIADEVRTGQLVILPIELPWLTSRYGFIYRKGRSLSPSAQTFMAIVREVERELHAGEPVTGASPRRRRRDASRRNAVRKTVSR